MRLRQNKSPDIDVKQVLKEIKEEAIDCLKKDFLGEAKQFEEYSKRLCQMFKVESKQVVADVKNKMDEALKEVINKRIADDIEFKIRRSDPTISSYEILLALTEDLLALLITEHHPA